MADDGVGAVIGDATCGVVDIHHRVDHGAGRRVRILDHVADGIGRRIEEGGDLGMDRKIGIERDGTHDLAPF